MMLPSLTCATTTARNYKVPRLECQCRRTHIYVDLRWHRGHCDFSGIWRKSVILMLGLWMVVHERSCERCREKLRSGSGSASGADPGAPAQQPRGDSNRSTDELSQPLLTSWLGQTQQFPDFRSGSFVKSSLFSGEPRQTNASGRMPVFAERQWEEALGS